MKLLEYLPVEILSLIMLFLEEKDLKSLSETCKMFRDILEYPGYWKKTRIRSDSCLHF